MKTIYTFTFKEKDIDVLYENKNLAYTFEHEGKHYGSKVELPNKSTMSIVSATWLLIQNAMETLDAVRTNNEDNKE